MQWYKIAMLESLAAHLRKHMGQPLTQQLAAELMLLALAPPVDLLHKFGEEEWDGYRFKVSPIKDCADQAMPMFDAYWREAGDQGRGLSPQFDLSQYVQAERSGRYALFTIWQGEELVGCTGMFASRNNKANLVFVYEDLLYVKAEHRRGWLTSRFFKYVERELIGLGVDEIRLTAFPGVASNKLLPRMGFHHYANDFVKSLKGAKP